MSSFKISAFGTSSSYVPGVIDSSKNTTKSSDEIIITTNKTVIKYIESHSYYSIGVPHTITVEVNLPTDFDATLYTGRVYMIKLEFNIFYAELGADPIKEHDIINPQITDNFTRQFITDTTWKFRIEPYDLFPIPIPVPGITGLMYKEFIDEVKNKLVYEFHLAKDTYFIIDNVLRLSSVYPSQQQPDNLKILYSKTVTP